MNKSIITSLQTILNPKRVSVKEADLKKHSKDASFHSPAFPDVVVWPKTTKEVSEILKLAYKYAIPVTAWGGGSSLEGNPIPVKGGIVLNMTTMNKIIKVFSDDLQVKVQPGIIGEALDRQLEPYNLWFAAAPGSKHLATIGGMIANNAGGMHAVKYGVVKDSVLALEAVLANGEIIKTGSTSFKSVSGYNLKDLLVGSEGTLAIITEAVLKLTPLPQAKIALMASFPTDALAAKTNLNVLMTNIKPASIEFMDKTYVGLVNKAKQTSLREEPTLLIELHGDRDVLAIQIQYIERLCKNNQAITCETYTTEADLKRLWEYRRAVRPVISTLLPGIGVLSAEIGVPISQIPNFLEKAEQVSQKYGLQTVMFGHMGDGNFHGWALYTLGNKKSIEKVTKLNEDLILFALKLGGTITGEHGLGIGKRKFLHKEHPTSLPLMKQLKELFDPKGILNPGKMFPD